MKRFLVLVSVVGNVVLLALLFLSTGHKAEQRVAPNAKPCRIAILKPTSHPAIDQVERGFVESMNEYKNLTCDYTLFDANGSEVMLRSMAESMVQKNFDIIFTIGARATLVAKEVTNKRQVETPIVFGAVADPVRLGIIVSEASSENHITGASTRTNYPEQIDFLCYLKADIKNVLIIYNPTQSSGLERDKNEVVELLASRSITARAVEVYKTSEVYQKLESLLQGVDALITFKDNTVIPAADAIIKLCNRYRVVYCATDLGSPSRGASMGYGVYEYDFGKAAAGQAYLVLHGGKKPSEIPVVATNNYRLKINLKAAQEQGLKIEQGLANMLSRVESV